MFCNWEFGLVKYFNRLRVVCINLEIMILERIKMRVFFWLIKWGIKMVIEMVRILLIRVNFCII